MAFIFLFLLFFFFSPFSFLFKLEDFIGLLLRVTQTYYRSLNHAWNCSNIMVGYMASIFQIKARVETQNTIGTNII